MVLEYFIHLPVFTSGERLTTFRQIRDIAARLGLSEVWDRAERGAVHDLVTRGLDDRWAEQLTGRVYAQRVSEIDNLVDPVLTSIRDIALSQVRALPPGHELVARVDAFLDDIYPAGVMAVVSLPFVDQVAATQVILDKLVTRHPALVARLGLAERVAYLAKLTVEYRDAVDQDRNLDFAQVRASREAGQLLLRELVALILGQFSDSRDPDNVSRRQALLEPVIYQARQSQKRRARRRGRADDDVADGEDPTEDTTGDTTGDATGDAQAPQGSDTDPAA